MNLQVARLMVQMPPALLYLNLYLVAGKEERLEEVQDGPLEEVQDGPLEKVQDGPLEKVQDGPLEKVQDGPLEEVQEGPLGRSLEKLLAKEGHPAEILVWNLKNTE
jgi:hypothetical protein